MKKYLFSMMDVYAFLVGAIVLVTFYIATYGFDPLIGFISSVLLVIIVFNIIYIIRLCRKPAKIKIIKVIDLTEKFGAGNEPSVEELDAIFEKDGKLK